MSRVYHEGHRSLQDRFDTRRLADRIEERLVRDVIDVGDKSFIERMSIFFLATSDQEGRPQCSYKGGAAYGRLRDKDCQVAPRAFADSIV
jgi:uncharacterized protein